MSANIKKLTTFIDSRVINIDFQGYKLIKVVGENSNKDTFLYLLERFLARDFDTYYDDIDKALGADYKSIEGISTLYFSNGVCYANGKKLEIKGNVPKLHCVRYTGKDRIRSFLIDSEMNNSVIGTDMTKFNSSISDSKWNRLATLMNKTIGYEVVKIDTTKRKIEFDIHDYCDWSVKDIKLVYLLLSESMLTPDDYTRVVLISDIDFMLSEQVAKIISALTSISRSEMIVFSSDIPQEMMNFSNKVFSISV